MYIILILDTELFSYFRSMQEDFLHYLWKFKKINVLNLVTTDFESVEILSVGQHNQNSGPDFFNASLGRNEWL